MDGANQRMSLTLAALIGLLLVSGSRGQSRCPRGCSCGPDEGGRKTVTCRSGGMKDVSFLSQMDISTKVLIVSAPEWYHNNITIGPIFKRFRAFLEEITITRSGVPAIGENSFFGLLLLKKLNLSDNRITHLYRNNFKGLQNLQVLDLSNNRIESVPSATFSYLPQLRRLHLSDNRLGSLVSRLLLGVPELRTLDLSGNQVSTLPPDVLADVGRLEELYCRRCDITRISPSLYQKVPYLRVLDLRDNHISTLRQDEFLQLGLLRDLRLGGNHFKSLNSLPFRGHDLDTLDLSRNELTSLSEDVFQDVTVQNLDLSYNTISSLPAGVLRPLSPRLRQLSLSGNPLGQKDIEPLGLLLPELRHISLADMGILSLSDSLFTSLQNLRSLNLSSNYLLSVSEHMLTGLTRLRRLDLSRNQLYALSAELTRQLDTLQHVRLHGNPWSCDSCRVRPLLRWLKTSPKYAGACADPRRGDCLRCARPLGMSGREVRMLNESQLPPCASEVDVSPVERCRREGSSGDPSLERYCAVVMSDDQAFLRPDETVATSQVGVVIGCVLALILITALILAVLLYNRHSAIYYTHEERREDSDVYQNPDVNRNKKKVRIATIDEMNCRDDSPFVDDTQHSDFQNG